VLASLNHPHIAQIHGLEDDQGACFLVLELVEGATLAERLKQGPLPLDDAVRIARQIADALESAHEKGVVHRDLKPANVALTTKGQVKVLDFGLATAPDDPAGPSDLTNSPTLTSPMVLSNAGVILGTAAYMSPEQARGKPVDHGRSSR
jgi:serine/threonine-protein kinase